MKPLKLHEKKCGYVQIRIFYFSADGRPKLASDFVIPKGLRARASGAFKHLDARPLPRSAEWECPGGGTQPAQTQKHLSVRLLAGAWPTPNSGGGSGHSPVFRCPAARAEAPSYPAHLSHSPLGARRNRPARPGMRTFSESLHLSHLCCECCITLI